MIKKMLVLGFMGVFLMMGSSVQAFGIGISTPRITATKVTTTKNSTKSSKNSKKTTTKVSVQPSVYVGTGGVSIGATPYVNVSY